VGGKEWRMKNDLEWLSGLHLALVVVPTDGSPRMRNFGYSRIPHPWFHDPHNAV